MRLLSRLSALVSAAVCLAGCQAAPEVTFPHGVASGDPLARSVILWTRVSPVAGEEAAGSIPVHWLVASDAELTNVVAEGRVETDAGADFTVNVEATGLEPGTGYHYRFDVGAATSPIGQTRTLPEGPTERLRLAVFSCSNYGFGFFNAYRAATAHDGIDAVLHLGDYIYEYGPGEYEAPNAEEMGRGLDPPHEILTLEDYRLRYAQYRTDPDLIELHRRFPFIVTWDDHETANNSWKGGAENHDEGEGPWDVRRSAAVQAFHEWMPIRRQAPDEVGRIYRSFAFGDLATLLMLDTRLVGRDRQLDYESDVDLEALDAPGAARFVAEQLRDPERSLLGAEQEEWLQGELELSRQTGVRWQLIGQQLILAPMLAPDLLSLVEDPSRLSDRRVHRLEVLPRYSLPLNLDAWDGYQASRERFYTDTWEAGGNVVVLSGDTHNAWAFDLLSADGSRQYGVELGVPGVSSPGLERIFAGADPEAVSAALIERNPHLAWANTRDRGYLLVDVEPDAVTGQWVFIDTVESRDFEPRCLAAWRVEATDGPGTGVLTEVPCSL